MNLDSVRGLKETLASQLLPKIETTVTARVLPFGLSAGPMRRTQEPPRTLALGVAPHGKGNFRLAVRVQKRAFEAGREVERITKQAKGEVDLRYVGRITKRAAIPWYQLRQRPLLIGSSVGHYKITAGTLGAFVRARGGGVLNILSNNHVLADENRAKRGDAVLQPGAYDHGVEPTDVVGALDNFIRLKSRGANLVDCAVALVNAELAADHAKLRGLGKLVGLGDAFVDEGAAVAKIGRTTGLTRGKVTAFELDNVVINYDIGKLRFDQQIEIEGAESGPFSQGGDSGSLIVDAGKRGIALLFAGSDQGGANGQGLTYANPLHAVLDALGMELALP